MHGGTGPPQDALAAFGVARATRDERRTYCTLYRPTGEGRFRQVAYSPDGQPFVELNGDGEEFTLTSRAGGSRGRIFDSNRPQPAAD